LIHAIDDAGPVVSRTLSRIVSRNAWPAREARGFSRRVKHLYVRQASWSVFPKPNALYPKTSLRREEDRPGGLSYWCGASSEMGLKYSGTITRVLGEAALTSAMNDCSRSTAGCCETL
jgi:hypothetical protein